MGYSVTQIHPLLGRRRRKNSTKQKAVKKKIKLKSVKERGSPQLQLIQDFMEGRKLDSFEPILFTVAAMKILILCSNEHKMIHSQPWQNL